MDSVISEYRVIIEKLLREYADLLGQDGQTQSELIFDRDHNHYLLIEAGWHNSDRIYGPFIHIDIIDGKLWIQHDGSEEGVAYELVEAGIPKEHIVLAYKSEARRQLTEFAVS